MNKTKFLVTTGTKYTDIDGFACVIVYAEYLRLKGLDVVAYLPGVMNFTCPQALIDKVKNIFVNSLPDDYLERKVVLLDMSEFKFVDQRIPIENYVAVIDHHPNFEEFWQSKSWVDTDIEVIGAAATIVWRRIKADGLANKLSSFMAKLLYTAIISNSLYLNAEVTQEEDRIAYKELKEKANIDKDYDDNYYSRVETEFFSNIDENLENDAKIIERSTWTYKIIQVELWKEGGFVKKFKKSIDKVLKQSGFTYFFLTIPCISERINYIYTPDIQTQKHLNDLLGWEFDEHGLAKVNKMMLRKEIIKLI